MCLEAERDAKNDRLTAQNMAPDGARAHESPTIRGCKIANETTLAVLRSAPVAVNEKAMVSRNLIIIYKDRCLQKEILHYMGER